MTTSANIPRWKRYLSPRFLAGKVRKKGIVWCIRTFWLLIRTGLDFHTRPIRAKLWSVCDTIRYRGRKQPNVLYAFYDLAVAPATFDIVKFLVLAELQRNEAGCDALHVVIVPGPSDGFRQNEVESYHRTGGVDYDTESLRWRLRNILVPCCWQIPSCQQITVCTSRKEALSFQVSLAKHIFPKGYTVRFPKTKYDSRFLEDAATKGAILPTMKATLQACRFVSEWMREKTDGRKVITITLRESFWHKDRNSSLDDWKAFACSLDPTIYCPVFIRDTEAAFKPLPSELDGLLVFPEASWNVGLRVALYELSYLNMFTLSGPSTLCWLIRQARSITFKLIASPFKEEYFRSRCKFEPGSQPKHFTPFHQLVWEDDRLEVIQEAFREMCDRIETASMEKRQTEHLFEQKPL